MNGTADADASAARLWPRWIAFFVHEVRMPIAVLDGYIKMARAEADPEKRARFFAAAQSTHARLVDYLTAMQQCSLRQATTLARLVRSLHRIYESSMNLTVTGDGETPVPCECLGIALWLLMYGQRAGRLEVHATAVGGRIALAPQEFTGEWDRIDGTDVRDWWLEDVVNYLTVTGSVVDVFCRGNEFSIVITWTRFG